MKERKFNIRKLKKNRKLLLVLSSSLHAVFLVFVSLWLLNKNISYGDEKFLIKWSTIFKKLVLKIDDKPPKSELLFINCTYDNILIDRYDEDGFNVGNQRITDRFKLAKLIGLMSKNPQNQKFVVCDIFFRDSSSADIGLQTEISKLNNFIIPCGIDKKDKPEKPLFKAATGYADYSVIDGSFLKFPLLYNDSVKSLPLKMFNITTGKDIYKKWIFYYEGNKLCLNNLTIDFKVRDYDIQADVNPEPYPLVNLGEFLMLSESEIIKMLKDRIVLIGDFKESDIHNTVLGKMPGTLILFNTYLTLLKGENIIHPLFFIILFIGYFFITIDVFSSKDLKERSVVKKITEYRIGLFFIRYFGYLVYLGFLSIILYFLYNIHINILILAIYLKTLESLLKHFRDAEIENKKKGLAGKFSGFRIIFDKLIKSDL